MLTTRGKVFLRELHNTDYMFLYSAACKFREITFFISLQLLSKALWDNLLHSTRLIVLSLSVPEKGVPDSPAHS